MENYSVTFYRLNCGREEKIMSCDSNQIPFIPRKKECVVLDQGVFKVKNVAMIKTSDIPIGVEVMLQEIDDDKEWWE